MNPQPGAAAQLKAWAPLNAGTQVSLDLFHFTYVLAARRRRRLHIDNRAMRLDAESRLSRPIDLDAQATEVELDEDDFDEPEQRQAPVTLQAINRPRPLQEAVANKASYYRTAPAPTQYSLEEIQRHSEDKAFGDQLEGEFKKHGCAVIKPSDRVPFAKLLLNSHLLYRFGQRTEFAITLISDKSLSPKDRMTVATEYAAHALRDDSRDRLKQVATLMKKSFPEEYQDFVRKVNDGASRKWVKLASWFSALGNAIPMGTVPPILTPIFLPLGMALGFVIVPPGLLIFGMAYGLDKLIRTNRRIDRWADGFESRFKDPQKTTKLLNDLNAGKLA